MTENQSSYRQIMKATTLFGGVQIFNIIIAIIRSKIIALLLGPSGIGIVSLLNSTTGFIGGLTNFGLDTSAVKTIASANSTGNKERIAIIIIVLRRLVWITGTLGTIVTIALSPWLSKIAFGNTDYTLAIIWISITLLFKQLTTGQLVILQGLRKLKHLAKANLAGSTLGLVIILPLYYFYRFDAIAPAIVITALTNLVLAWYFSRKVKIESVNVSLLNILTVGKKMLSMGLMISLSGLITIGVSYIVRIFISTKGGIDEVGFYNAGFVIINTYVGLVFTAMGTDYYPRLSSVAYSNELCKKTINQQAEISILILAPIIIIFLGFINWIVIILYSNKFIVVVEMIHWAAIGMFFKAASWSIGFILLAKGAYKLFFYNELIANIYFLSLNLLFYYFWGLMGLGISFMVGYILYLFQLIFLSRIKYNFNFDTLFINIFIFQFLLALSCFIVVKLLDKPDSYILCIALLIISLWYSYKKLDRLLDLKMIVLNIKEKFLEK